MTTLATPKYRHFKPKNLAVVRLDGHDYYLGTYGSPESLEKYHRLLAERLSAKPNVPARSSQATKPLTISELLNRYRIYAERYYVQDGRQTKEFVEMKYAARPLRAIYGGTSAASFGPLALKAVRERMVTVEDLSRKVANHRINRIKRIFKWAVSEELIPSSVYESIRTVDGLRIGRTDARETEPVKPVDLEHVAVVYEYVAPQVATMIRVQLLTAMRPCEVVAMRRGDIDTSGQVWQYNLEHHKNQWRGLSRVIPLGPQAQELLKPFMDRSPRNACRLVQPRFTFGDLR
jgi:integrase